MHPPGGGGSGGPHAVRFPVPMLPRPAVPRRSADPRLAAAVLAFALVVAIAPGASASLQSRLSAAKHRLDGLAARIKTEEAKALTLQDQLTALNARIAAATRREGRITDEIATTRAEIETARAQEAALQAKFDAVVRTMFMEEPGGVQAAFLDSVLSSTSIADLSDRVAFASAVAQGDLDLANQVANAKARLVRQAADQNHLLSRQARLLAGLDEEQTAKAQAITAERQALANLDRTKTQILDLVVRLRKRLKAQELAGIAGAFQGADHITYGAWARLFLKTMGVSSCHSNMVVLVAWQLAEFTQAAWNPLATTYPMPGSTVFNSSNVRNYPSLAEGLQATRNTIVNGSSSFGYGAIVSTLSQCSDPMTTARAINASAWCRGCAGGAYVTGDVPKVEANYRVYAAL